MIPFNAPPVVGTELDYMQSAMGSCKLCGDGGFTRRCQQWMEQRFHSANVLLTPSCTASLELATLLLDALKMQQRATLLTNVDAISPVQHLAQQLSATRLHAVLAALVECREQLLTVVGVNRELLLTDLLLRVERYLQPGATLPSSHL